MSLFPVQAAVLIELHDHGGCFAQAGVGQGKTLISALAATVVDAERPLLLVPAKLKDKTIDEFRKLSAHWRIKPIRIESYEILSRTNGGHMLSVRQPDREVELVEGLLPGDAAGDGGTVHEVHPRKGTMVIRYPERGYKPDLVILDEAHKAKNKGAALTKKLRRYIREYRPKVLDMSGTMSKRSIQDFYHLAEWARPDAVPLPAPEVERKLWGAVVDEKPRGPEVDPGALYLLGDDPDPRVNVGRRIFDTPGFIATKKNDIPGCSLIVECHQVEVPPEIDAAFLHMKQDPGWETVDGHPIDSGIEMWRHCRELACGFYKRWEPRPPEPWLCARRNWFKAVRLTVQNNRRGLDSPKMVLDEVLATGESHELWEVWSDWQEVEDTFTPNSVDVWISDYAVDWVEAWAKTNTGLIWVEWPAFGQRLAKRLGVEYYGQQGLNSKKQRIDADGVEDGSRCAVASIKANGEGRNLQGIWSRALITSAPPTGTETEQVIGRLHRPGQLADEVVIDVMIAAREQLNGFLQALRDADFHSSVLQAEMRFLEAPGKAVDIVLPTFNEFGGAWAWPRRE